MASQLRPLVVVVVFLGALLYAGGIIWAGVASLRSAAEPELPDLITQAITAIGAALATHFGALFGISQFTGGNPRPIPSPLKIHSWATLPSRPKRKHEEIPREALRAEEEADHRFDKLQIAAAYFYLGSLILAAAFWAFDGGFSKDAAEALRTMSYSLLGVIVGIMTIVLNIKKTEA